ncbi:MAG: efflux RND transporter periplasmic adaptor subunit [Bryobacterales bacterium]|nr:efflux RND transporter periplasmic adaptor subunit [Bryobacterales bacterium]
MSTKGRRLTVALGLATAVISAFGWVRAAHSARQPEPSPVAAPPRPGQAQPAPEANAKVVRATGLIQAEEWQSIRVPHMTGVGGFEITLTRIAPNGAQVAKGGLLVEFDRLNLLDQEREAVALLDSLTHQLEERKAQVSSLQATRESQISEAQAELDRANLQLRKGPVLGENERLKNEAKAGNAVERLASLKRTDGQRAKAEAASVKILELKSGRQRVTLERLRTNLERLQIKAPQDGMVVHENTWRQGSMGPPQVGDRMWPGMPVMRIFNPARMVVQVTVDEPDFAVVSKAAKAQVHLDAYPEESFSAALQSASPVATAGLDSPVRSFVAIFRLEQQSPRLLPDLSAALQIEGPAAAAKQ